ncbi:hypothetical protein GCM10011416_16510 [Polaribacter pacificus]|uniref:HTH araC/xylS-type domain-containing protein n=1 Tax=Polaribacter pacificus TaxID=1775173 RepID=A0A917MDH7_9FLAO|nr:hypothetical protein GCM10011416_16510 [Polaribacter pacificus]
MPAQTKTEVNDSLKAYSYRQLSEKFYASKSDSLKAIIYAKAYLTKATLAQDTMEIANGYYFLSDVTKDPSYYINYLTEIINKYQKTNNKKYPALPYLELGDYYYNRGKYDLALSYYIKAKNSSITNQNEEVKFVAIQRLALLKSINEDNKAALKLFKELYNNYKNKNTENDNNYHSLLINITISFIKLNEYDSASYYNKKVRELLLKSNNTSLVSYTIYHKAKIEYLKKNYTEAIVNFKKSLPGLLNDQNYNLASACYNFLQQAYEETGNNQKAIVYALKIDSLYKKNKFYHSSQRSAYKGLIAHYRAQKNDHKELEYINKYIRVDSALNSNALKMRKNLTNNYDIPKLLEERKALVNRLENRLTTTKKWLMGIGVISLVFILYFAYQARRNKVYKKRFTSLINSQKTGESNAEEQAIEYGNDLPEEVVTELLQCLDLFEKNHKYLSKKITLPSLAKSFHTNSSYLSKVINQYKKQSFRNYINKLRIDYAVERLKTDRVFRKYTHKAIGEEVGFKSTEAFTKAFYKHTGIKASFFITEFEKF